MACLLGVFGLALPRVVMVVLWIFSDYLGRAYEGWVVPLIGFFVLPTTTLAYAVAQNETDGVQGWGLVFVILGVAVDLGLLGGGRGIFNRD
ncbi:MAG: hypothetical protein ACRDKZ_06495 [Actinomycetota bacterium]